MCCCSGKLIMNLCELYLHILSTSVFLCFGLQTKHTVALLWNQSHIFKSIMLMVCHSKLAESQWVTVHEYAETSVPNTTSVWNPNPWVCDYFGIIFIIFYVWVSILSVSRSVFCPVWSLVSMFAYRLFLWLDVSESWCLFVFLIYFCLVCVLCFEFYFCCVSHLITWCVFIVCFSLSIVLSSIYAVSPPFVSEFLVPTLHWLYFALWVPAIKLSLSSFPVFRVLHLVPNPACHSWY